ncbi:hypothetical protein AVEN_238588-1 [Araneus ventricosus]|uniref:Uncharacterized protein n=1 Tax=Araneus ventricosus TaxID=182803 RepID=A0A4Y2GR28_ARAVE|nr:hypothetical protein AVEN_238588-1 [Araneus ventricosus]
MYEKIRYSNLERFLKTVVTAAKSLFAMPCEKKERASLMKSFYQNGSNLSTALLEYPRSKDLQKRNMSRKKVIIKFEDIGNLVSERKRMETAFKKICESSRSCRGRKSVWFEIFFDNCLSGLSLYVSAFVYSAKSSIIKWYPYKIHFAQALNSSDQDKRNQFSRMFLAITAVDNS